ncbi:hypothetical protein N1031_02325 [Herbiconiux moechotypicola]|uniref:Uncharacterized protein n=1 Tax=Herbiconiux moechotypicola TaxID=637393 RepID=A0ABN3D6H4_9MICO|nr:hypothetical protein [Herbiconiux moechotypicola]MCS5728584.1 hypothetical protein [Herbiconiux moechotypicola]
MGNDETPRHPISRRTLLKAGAWSVPVVALAVATPAAAASTASVYYVYQSYAGYSSSSGTFVLEAYIYVRDTDTPVQGTTVTWTLVETGQAFQAVTGSNGFARVDTDPSAIVGEPTTCEITALDARTVIEVQGTGPV